jgi:flagellar basal body P-ring formation protein FlgA
VLPLSVALPRRLFSKRRASWEIGGFEAFRCARAAAKRQAAAGQRQDFAGHWIWHGVCTGTAGDYQETVMTPIFRHLALAAALTPVGAYAEVFQDLDAVDAKARAIVAESGLAVRPADRRLKLAPCPHALEAEAQSQGAVAVRCSTLGWRIRLPVEGVVRGDNIAPMIIRRGDPVSVEFSAPGFAVTANGIAQNEARKGEPVRVQVEAKGSPVMGEAIDVGSVRVGGFKR